VIKFSTISLAQTRANAHIFAIGQGALNRRAGVMQSSRPARGAPFQT